MAATSAVVCDTSHRAPSEVHDPWLAAYARWREAEVALSERGGKARAEAALRLAHEIALRLGAEPLSREIGSLAKRARLDLEPEDATTSEAAPEVLGLVAEGKTNRQIADELFITEKTAGHHVSNVLGKLGASSRVEAAAMAHRAGWLDTSLGDSPAR